MKKFFQSKKFISVTAGVLATSLVVGNLAISRSKMKKGQISSSATVYADDHLLDFDASSQVNFSTILGRAIDYGIVSDVVDQKGHMETTYATNKFVNPGAANNCDVDLAGNATAQFIIASVENGSKARFGNTYNGQEMPFVIDTTYDMAANEDANFVYDTVCKASVLYRTYDYDVLKSNVDSMISKGKKQSDILAAKPAFDGNTIATKRGDSGATVDLSDPSYQNATVYINVEGGSQLETAIQNADGLLIKKHPSTNVVFNMLGTGEIKLTQYRVQIVGETFTLDPDNGKERSDYSFDSTTTCGGYDSLHNAHVEEYMTKSIIFNIRNASSVKYNMTAGLFLVPNNIPGEVVGSSAGWIVSSGRTTVSSGEFHYIYHDREYVANTEGTSVIHFAARKAFTEDYDNINELTNVALTKGEYKFSFIETESDYRTEKEGGVKDLNCAVDAYSKITFPNITVAVETVDPYIPQKRYFVVRENPTTSDDPNVGLSNPTDPKVELSEGEIDIELTITNVDGIIHYYVNTFKYYEAKNGQQPDDGDNNVAASGAEFSLGGFYNKYDVETGKLTLKKAIDGDSPANDYPDKTYKMAVRKGLLYVQQDGSLSVDEYYFQVPADSNGIEISGLTPGDYTIVEDEGNLRGYNFVSSSMSSTVTVNNTTSGPNDITADGKVSLTGSSEAEVVVTNTYEKIDVSGKASLTINKQIEVNGEAMTPDTIPEELASQEYSFYVSTISGYDRLFLTDYNGSLGQDSQKYTFKTTYGEPIVIYGLEPNKEYIVQEVAPNGQLRSYNLHAISIDGTDYSNNIYNAAKGITTGAADSNTNVDVVNGYQEIKKNLTIRKAFVNAQNSGMSIAPEDLDKLEGIRLTVKGPNGFKQEITGTQLRKNNWQYTLNNVPVGDYVVEETGADETGKGQYVFSYCDVTGNSPTRDNDGTLTVTNRYSVVSLGVLTVRKGINANGAATPAFFEVYIQNEDGKYYTDEGPERFVPDKRAVRVPANGSFQTVAIPEGKYTVTENAESARVAGYELVTSYKTGNEEGINYINLKNYGGTVEVTNTYTKYKIEVTKQEAGDHMYDNWTYQFWVRDLNRTDGVYYIKADGESARLEDGQDPYYFSVKAGDSNSETVLLKNAGQYQVIEKNANEAANNAFDLTTTYSVADGIVTVSDSDASSAAAVTITNTYKYTNVGSLTVGKTLTGTGKDTQKAFDIVITFSTPINYSVNGGEKIATASDTYTAHLKDTETVTLGDIPAGVTYTVSETISQADQIAGYELSSITGDTDKAIKKNVTNVVTVNNTFAFESVESTVKKVWDDSNNQDGIRPASVTVQMKRNGVDFGEPVVLSADNNWTFKAENLAKYDASKNAYTYTWAETAVADYEASYETEGTVTTVTNTHTAATTSLSVEKKWNHKMNPASNQPASVEVKLYAGDSLVATKTLSADNQWKETVSNLPVKAGGTDIEYRWEETVPDNYKESYTVEAGKTTITNTYDSTTETTSATVKKAWVDNNDQDGIRPASVTVQLKRNDEDCGDPVVLNDENNWTYEADNLAKYDAADALYTYTWEESAVSGYDTAYETSDTVTTITNTHTTATTSLSVEKVWNHKTNAADKYPTSVEVTLYAGDAVVTTKTLSADNQWKETVTDLPVKEDGADIEYRWEETDVPENYTPAYTVADGKTTITNTYDSSVDTTSATVKKVWEDNNNQDGIRPASVTVQLKRNGEAFGDAQTLSASNNWTCTVTGLQKYDSSDNEYAYTWEETAVSGYEATYDTNGNVTTVTNTHETATTSLSVEKVWNHKTNASVPASVEVKLYADGETVATKILSADNQWKATETDLPVNKNGVAIEYEWKETAVDNYTAEYAVSGTATTITNTYDMTVEKVSAAVEKDWVDDNDRDGIRPTSVTVQLKRNGEACGDPVVLNAGNGWTHTEENLQKYDSSDNEYTYTWEETAVDGYTASYAKAGDVTTITNTHEIAKTSVSVEKIWNHKMNPAANQPTSVTVKLMVDGVAGKNVVLNAENNWKATESDLPVYKNKKKIEYKWEEVVPANYTASYTTNEGTTTITNTYDTSSDTTSATVKKAWSDDNNRDGIRPASVTVQLMRNSEKCGDAVVLNAANNWTYTVDNLEKYDATDALYSYTWEETAVSGYTASYATEGDVTTVTNTHDVAKTSLSVEKAWNHKTNANPPESVEVKLYAGANVVATKILNAANGWKETVSDLPVKEGGADIEYRWEETVPANYTAAYSVNGATTTITNTYDTSADTTSVTVKKVWSDDSNRDGIRPASVTVQLKRNGENCGEAKTLSASNNWTITETGLQKYDSSDNEYTYTWVETDVTGYTASYKTEGAVTTITNTHEIAKTSLSVEKVWNHKTNANLPASVEVKLYAGNNVVATKTLSAANQWKETVTDLPVKDGGADIEYRWEETVPANYAAEYAVNGTTTTITNTFNTASETVSATVKKVWSDDNNRDGIRPANVKVQLKQNGANYGEVMTLSDANEWSLTLTDLPKYDSSDNAYTYTWEETAVDGYTTAYAASGTVTTITNTHAPDMTSATVKKVWDDDNNRDGIRPAELKVKLLRNGEEYSEVTLNEANSWSATVENLPVKTNTMENTYTWSETLPDNYTLSDTSKNGTITTLTNTHVTEKTSATVKKVWDDQSVGTHPTSLTVKLSNGQTVVLDEDNGWTKTISDLPKYENGSEITYSWTEVDAPDDYTMTGSDISGTITTITNTYNLGAAKTSATIQKVWDDSDNAAGMRPATLTFDLYQDGTKIDTVTLNESNSWTATVNNLEMYKDSGEEHVYTWTEGSMPDGYAQSGESVNGTTTTVTNTYTAPVQVKGNLRVYKVLGSDAPADALVKIYKFKVTGTKGYEKTFEIQGAGYYDLTDLELDTYTITEDEAEAEIDGYTLSVSNNGISVELTDDTLKEESITNNYAKKTEPTESSTEPTESSSTPTGTKPSGTDDTQPTDSTAPSEDGTGRPTDGSPTPTPDKEIESVTIDDQPVSPDDYKKKPDGTVEFTPETIEGLTLGVHRAVIRYKDGTKVTIEFEVISSARGKKIVKTGDVAGHSMIPVATVFLAASAAVVLVILRKRKNERYSE